ncbi:MAG: DNA-directed RNA polymerase subunit omega [Proteobacteria bacterium]|nr:DNA-directed RNA polymerase subunit omega [Pseudomonadota bacterium]
MARVTVEDCVLVVPNRFELCLIANNRAKAILSGAATNMDRKEKTPVIALREIAEDMVDIDNVRKVIVHNIKNANTVNYEEFGGTQVNKEIVEEEIEDQNLVLKDNTFLEDNLAVDD